MSQKLPPCGVSEAACETQLLDFPKIVQNKACQYEIAVDPLIVVAQLVTQFHQGNHVLEEPAQVSMMKARCSGGKLIFFGYRGVFHQEKKQPAQRTFRDASYS